MSNIYQFEDYYWERHGLEAIEAARDDPDNLDALVEPGFEAPYGSRPAPEPRPKTYDLQMLAQLTAKLARDTGFQYPIDEEALEAAFHFAKEQAERMEVPLPAALELAAYAVLNYERGRRDPELCRIRPF